MTVEPSVARVAVRGTAIAILFAAACSGGAGGGGCGGGGCLGCGEGDYEYPVDDPNRPDAIVQEEALRARITQAFVDFIQPQLPAVIRGALDGQSGMVVDADDVLHLALPDQNLFDIGVAEAKLREAEAQIWLDDLDQRLELEFVEPSYVRLTMDNLRLGLSAKLKEDVIGTTSSCPLEGTLGTEPHHAAQISVEATIDPGVSDPDRNFDIQVKVDDIELNDLAVRIVGDYCSERECQDCVIEISGSCYDPGGRCAECHIFCGGITDGLLRLVGALVDVLRPLLNRVMKPVIQNFIRSAVADINNQPARIEQLVDLAEITGVDAFRAANPFGIMIGPEPGRFPVIDRGTGVGMEITSSGGAEAELADCVGAIEDFAMPKGPVPVLGGTDSKGRPYHVGVTLASSLLNQMLYAMHRSGSLCLKLGSEDIKGLTGGQFVLNASVLSLLASDLTKLTKDTAPVILQLKPRYAPILDLGSGEVVGQDDMGNDIFDWLIKLEIEDMGLAFHVLSHDRYVRIFEVTMDVNVGFNVVVLPDNRLEVAVGKVQIDDFREVFNEILPNADFAQVLPTLIDLALQALVSNQLTFDLDISSAISDALGGAPVYMRVNDIFRDGIQEDYLTMTMTFTSSQGGNLSLGAETHARLAQDDGLLDEHAGRRRPSGRARLLLGESLGYVSASGLEYQVRVDRGLWQVPRPAQPNGTLQFADGHLVVPGLHKVEVRARYAGDYQSLDPTPAVVMALVDPEPPVVAARFDGEAIAVDVIDLHSPAGLLRLNGRLDGGQWFPIALTAAGERDAHARISLSTLAGAMVLELSAVDGAANASQIAEVQIADMLISTRPEAAVGCACHHLGDTPHPHGYETLLLIGLLIGLMIVVRLVHKR